MKNKRNAPKDFNFSMLPKNRREAFSFLTKMNYRQFVYLGILFLLFMFPVIITFSLKNIHLGILQNTFINEYNLAEESSKAAIEDSYINAYISLSSLYLWITFIFIVPVFISLGGILRVLRQYIWFEPVFFKEDFVKGIKDNWKATLLWGTIAGLGYVLSSYALILPGLNQFIVYLPYAVLLIVILPICLLVIEQSIVYQETNLKYFTNSLILYIKHLLYILLFSLICYLPFAFIYAGEIIGGFFYILFIIIFMALVIFVLPLFLLIHLLNAFRIFDISINRQNYPQLMGKGLFVKGEKHEL